MPFFDRQPVMDGAAFIYRRAEEGNFFVSLWVPSAKRHLKKSLKTASPETARERAMSFVLDKLATERAGLSVFSGTVADMVNAWETKQLERMSRGERRSKSAIEHRTRCWRKQLASCFGPLDQVLLSSLNQETWEKYVAYRGPQVKLSTLRQELDDYNALVENFGIKIGCPVVPDFSNIRVPKQERSRRWETFTPEEFVDFHEQLAKFTEPENKWEHLYERKYALHGKRMLSKGQFNQKEEAHRRKQLRLFVLVLASAGCRPGEILGHYDSSLRWQDVEEANFEVDSTITTKTAVRPKRAVFLHIRSNTKTGRRMVPALVGEYLDKLKDLNPDHCGPEDMVFAELDGRPTSMNNMRLLMREVVERWGFSRFPVELYNLRHFFCSEALKRGVSTSLLARAMGTSENHVQSTYGHLVMSEENLIRQLYATDIK